MTDLLIIAHGSRRCLSNQAVTGLAEKVTLLLPIHINQVHVAFLDFATPTIKDAINLSFQKGAEKILVLPYFLTAGTHVTKDVPREINHVMRAWPGKSTALLPHIGELDDIARLIVKSCLAEMSHLDGYILMKNSPSCGLERIKVFQPNGHPHQIRTTGVFAKALKGQYPLMPIEEEGRLHDDKLFDNFVLRVYAYSNFRKEVLELPSLHNLIIFHSRYKYLLMAHNQDKYRALGRLLGSKNSVPLATLINSYLCDFIEALSKPACRKSHTNALFHILGYLKGNLTSVAREHIIEIIHNYNKGLTPLTTPLTLLKHHLMQHGSTYIQHQRYLEPYPEKINPVIRYL